MNINEKRHLSGEDYRKFHLELSDPVVVGQGKCEVWGPYQFPELQYTRTGSILCSWAMHYDTIEYTGETGEAVSDDGGCTWRRRTDEDIQTYDVPMENGKCFAGFVGQGAYAVDYLDKYTPVCRRGDIRIYSAHAIAELDKDVLAQEYDPETGEVTTFPTEIRWPNMPLMVYPGDRIYPICQSMAIGNRNGRLALDDGLYFCTYCGGYDCFTGEVTPYSGCNSVYIFRSTDCARTWDLWSQISVTEATYNPAPHFEGLDEPMMAQMPDGSVVMLMRTGSGLPSYIVRSTDHCRTWSEPEQFDEIGVLPLIVPLGCGVTLSSYGRHKLYLRATSDPSGMQWQDHIELELTPGEGNRSCYYTHLLPLDDTSALMSYTDFHYPGPDGEPMKTVLVRKITVVRDKGTAKESEICVK